MNLEFNILLEMSRKELGEIEDITEISFGDFYKSRLLRIRAGNKCEYYLRRIVEGVKKPVYYTRFRVEQILSSF